MCLTASIRKRYYCIEEAGYREISAKRDMPRAKDIFKIEESGEKVVGY